MTSWLSRLRGTAPRPGAAASAAAVPEGTIVYAIGDIHGRLDLLRTLEAKIADDAAASDARRQVIVGLGDYVDRGPESWGVIEHLRGTPPPDFERVCVIGNHEAYMLRFLDDTSVLGAWLANGGHETLVSYGVTPPLWSEAAAAADAVQQQLRDRLPPAHEAFLRALVPYHREGDYFFTHAGVRPGVSLDQQDPYDLMWIRDEFLRDRRDFGAVVVHGHTIRPQPDNLTNRIGIDTGAFASGVLTCVALWRGERRFLST